MKKRLVSILATVVMAASILEAAAEAEELLPRLARSLTQGERHLLRNRKRLEKKLL